MIHTLKIASLIAATTGLLAFPVSADDQNNLKTWAIEAGHEISASMHYPKIALRQGHVGSTSYIVTVNRDGDLMKYHSAGRKGKATFGSASRRALKLTNFPALPDSYDGEQLTFKLTLDYKEYVDPTRQRYLNLKNHSKGSVTGTRIAFLNTNASRAGK